MCVPTYINPCMCIWVCTCMYGSITRTNVASEMKLFLTSVISI